MDRSTYTPHKLRVRINEKIVGLVLTGILTAAIGFLTGMYFPVAFTTKVRMQHQIRCGGMEVPAWTAAAANHSSCSCCSLCRDDTSSTAAASNATVARFSENFDIVLFHYDGRTTEWDEFKWSREVVHVSAKKQTKWWFAKRFLHPSTVAPYDYVFLWDEDVGVKNFTAEGYLDIVRKYSLEISQPGLYQANGRMMYAVTNRRNDTEMHKNDAGGEYCWDEHKPPCSGFVEVNVPVFSRDAWKCVWHMIQNDLVHAWGLNSNFWRCVEDPAEQIGIIDAQYLFHYSTKTLKSEGEKEKPGGQSEVRARQLEEMETFNFRITKADKELTEIYEIG